MTGIYKITNKINNKIYIGQSVHIKIRFKEHLKRYKYEDKPLYLAMKKYGIKNFNFEILEECEIENLDNREKFYINEYNSISPFGYNITDGGQQDNHTNYIHFNSEDIKSIQDLLINHLDISINKIAKKFNTSFQAISNINTGKTHREKDLSYPLRNRYNKTIYKYKCTICGKDISHNTKNQLCQNCFFQQKHKNRPDKNELAIMIDKLGFKKVGEQYNVSGNAIVKWCKLYNLPFHKKEIKEYVKNLH